MQSNQIGFCKLAYPSYHLHLPFVSYLPWNQKLAALSPLPKPFWILRINYFATIKLKESNTQWGIFILPVAICFQSCHKPIHLCLLNVTFGSYRWLPDVQTTPQSCVYIYPWYVFIYKLFLYPGWPDPSFISRMKTSLIKHWPIS